ncbi:hypothetical protein [Stenotrophomonas maltophilia]|uniref:hypothetical protein n=1 Tax=Stenotrophomonas maltophilia TaxID=40324 RepID=UPI0039C3D76B
MKAIVYMLMAVGAIAIASGCTSSTESNEKFPEFPVAESIKVYRLDSMPAKCICATADSGKSRELISMLSRQYPAGWRSAKKVSLAPLYRIVAGDTEILVLRHGLAISMAGTSYRKPSVVVRELKTGEADSIPGIACSQLIPD